MQRRKNGGGPVPRRDGHSRSHGHLSNSHNPAAPLRAHRKLVNQSNSPAPAAPIATALANHIFAIAQPLPGTSKLTATPTASATPNRSHSHAQPQPHHTRHKGPYVKACPPASSSKSSFMLLPAMRVLRRPKQTVPSETSGERGIITGGVARTKITKLHLYIYIDKRSR